jgi:hypothetical protein
VIDRFGTMGEDRAGLVTPVESHDSVLLRLITQCHLSRGSMLT